MSKQSSTRPRIGNQHVSPSTPPRTKDNRGRGGRSGRCPETRQGGVAPLDPPPKAAAFGIHPFGGCEGGVWGWAQRSGAVLFAEQRRKALRRSAAPSPTPHPHTRQTDGSQRPLPLVGGPGGQRPLGGFQGSALTFLPSPDCPWCVGVWTGSRAGCRCAAASMIVCSSRARCEQKHGSAARLTG